MGKVVCFGIIGANAERECARESHIPAVRHLAGLDFATVANKGQETAAVARAFGVAKAYGNVAYLLRDPRLDLVTVAVTLPITATSSSARCKPASMSIAGISWSWTWRRASRWRQRRRACRAGGSG